MPELPEVETVRRQLAGSLAAKTFTAVNRVEPAMLLDCTRETLERELPGRTILEVGRHGKFIIVSLEGDAFLTLHLGMTGQLLVRGGAEAGAGEASPHTRFLFGLEDAAHHPLLFEFRDMRKFGRLHLTFGGPAPRLAALGPDAWNGGWDAAYLADRLKARRAPLKAFLLDQRNLSGIGNIYADEILWWAELSPLRPAGSLSGDETARLAEEVRHRLSEGVSLLGCSISSFVDTEGRKGSFQNWLKAYGKYGTVCPRCGDLFVRVIVAGRGTSYSPGCQR